MLYIILKESSLARIMSNSGLDTDVKYQYVWQWRLGNYKKIPYFKEVLRLHKLPIRRGIKFNYALKEKRLILKKKLPNIVI